MQVIFALLLILHGIAHLVGFAGPWGLIATVAPQAGLLAGRIPMSAIGMRVVGIFWLGGALAFTIAGVGALRHTTWWSSIAFGAAIASLLLCIASLPQARIGIPINVGIILALLVTRPEVVRP